MLPRGFGGRRAHLHVADKGLGVMDYLAVTTSTQLNAVNVPAVASRNNGETPGSSLSFAAELNRALETTTLSEPGVAGTPADSKPQPGSGTDGARATGSPVAPPAPEPSSPVPGGTVTAESQVTASPNGPRLSQAESNGHAAGASKTPDFSKMTRSEKLAYNKAQRDRIFGG